MKAPGRFLASLAVFGLGATGVAIAHGCGDTRAPDAGLPDVRQPDAGHKTYSIVFILTDDLSWNLIPYMPQVHKMQQRGVSFSNYFVTDSLCCPSRSSIFTGKFPHDTTVFTNGPHAGGYEAFVDAGNAKETFAVTLQAAGYRTAMMGKYLNGYDPRKDPPEPGWVEWDVAGPAYAEFDYELNRNSTIRHYGRAPGDYMTDVLSGLATTYIGTFAQVPFAIEVATFAPHSPFVPAPRYLGRFDASVPRTPAFAHANVNAPRWLQKNAPLTDAEISQIDAWYNLRVESVQAVDDLIAAVMAAVDQAGIADRTYVVFSSDNGYHLGEHNLNIGKQTAFETDIRVPLVVVGPGVPAGITVSQMVENTDLCPTFAEIAGTGPPAMVDGRSILPLIEGRSTNPWRDYALVEHRGPDVAPMQPSDPDSEGKGSDPNSYEALRAATFLYVEYLDGETEYYDLKSDPYEITNTVRTLPASTLAELHQRLVRMKTCQGPAACWDAQRSGH